MTTGPIYGDPLPDTPLARRYPGATERAQRVLLALYDAAKSLTMREVIERLSHPMSRKDAEAARRRLQGAQLIRFVRGTHPQRYRLTALGERLAEEAVQRGAGY